jgi:hypothetical protein
MAKSSSLESLFGWPSISRPIGNPSEESPITEEHRPGSPQWSHDCSVMLGPESGKDLRSNQSWKIMCVDAVFDTDRNAVERAQPFARFAI